MIEVFPGLFVGGADDFTAVSAHEPPWAIVSAAKEPWHRQALGYTERAAPKDHPEYLIAQRDGHLILNLVDADDPAYIPAEIMEEAVSFIAAAIDAGDRVLLHCNQGMSRSPSIALLYLRRHDPQYASLSFEEGVELFKEAYPTYEPKRGVSTYVQENW